VGGVNIFKKYRLKRLFSKMKRFKQNKTCLINGLLTASFFGIYSRFIGRNGLQMPLAARHCDHVGEFGKYGILSGFCVAVDNSVVWGSLHGFIQKCFWEISVSPGKIFSGKFFARKKIFPGFFCRQQSCSGNILWRSNSLAN
jgi:hypothetical protein